MSNVPAYPKNPALHPESAPDVTVEDTGAVEWAEPEPAQIKELDLSSPALRIRELFTHSPIQVLAIATGIGFFAGRLARR